MPFYEMTIRHEDSYSGDNPQSDKTTFQAPSDEAAMKFLRSDQIRNRYTRAHSIFGRISRIDAFVQINEDGKIIQSQKYTNVGRENWTNERHIKDS